MPVATLLDASALVALVRKEKGWQTLDAITNTGLSTTTPNALAETLQILRLKNTGISSTEVVDLLKLKGVQVIPMIEEDGIEAAYLYKIVDDHNAKGKIKVNISLGDVTLLAVGKRLQSIVVFSDHAWELLILPGITLKPFR
jgi:PIN domain nuclease of toxin-antitoxin system